MAPYKHFPAQFPKPGYGFQPRKPVRSFLDLEVYQKSLNLSVMVMKHMVFPVELGPRGKDNPYARPRRREQTNPAPKPKDGNYRVVISTAGNIGIGTANQEKK